MKDRLRDIFLALVIAWVIPWLALGISKLRYTVSQEPDKSTEIAQQVAKQEMTIRVLTDNRTEEMKLSEYLVGVLLAELPGTFHMEAKKAQAVVARTYTVRTVMLSDKHDGAICTDSTCCQAYTDPRVYQGGSQWIALAEQAVSDTEDLVLVYGNELIEATYFSCSGGLTEDAVAVWGTDVPYLQSVESPGEETASVYMDTKIFSKQELEQALSISLTGTARQWFDSITYTEGGGVASVRIGEKTWQGTELRGLLGLRSTAFTVTAGENCLTFTTRGFGHRVGMSQYGAEAMAQSGKRFQEILVHYYQNTRIETLNHIIYK